MKRLFGAVASVCLLAACGGSGFEGTGEETPAPVVGEKEQSLWPLQSGRTWTYGVTDPLRGVFDKTVVVQGEEAVPEQGGTAIAVVSTQPHLEERSWQTKGQDGTVMRVREEDRRAGELLRVTTWTPSTVKSLAEAKEAGFSLTSTVTETVKDGQGTVTDVGDKTFVWRVLAVNETVTVPAGTFTNAIKVQRDRPDKTGKERIYWLVPGVGKVREEGERLEELKAFTEPTE